MSDDPKRLALTRTFPMGGKNPTQNRLPDMRFRREEDQYDFASHTKRVRGQSPLGQSLDDRASKRIRVAANKDDSDTDESEDDRRAFREPTSNQKRIREVSPELPNKRHRDEDYGGASSSEDKPLDEFVTRAKRVREQSPLEQSLDDRASKRIRVAASEDDSDTDESEDDRRAFREPTSNQKRIREVSPELPNKRHRDEDYGGASSSEDEPLDEFVTRAKRVREQSPLEQSLDDRASKRIRVAASEDDSDTDESEDDRRAFREPTSNQKRIHEVSPELPNKRHRDEDYGGASSSEDEPLDEFVTRAKRVREQSPLEQSLDDRANKRIRVTESEDGSNAESDGTVEPGKRAGCAVISTLLTSFLSLHLAGICIESQICATNDGRE
ncbi:hypothetical protein EYR40_000445 [Pleurotus pulmonarius]|nr:hypothetical protein EYR40_000445 [Pleurotus pulmonarius]